MHYRIPFLFERVLEYMSRIAFSFAHSYMLSGMLLETLGSLDAQQTCSKPPQPRAAWSKRVHAALDEHPAPRRRLFSGQGSDVLFGSGCTDIAKAENCLLWLLSFAARQNSSATPRQPV